MDVTYFKTPTELRNWFESNHETSKELWIGFYKKHSGKKGISLPEALDQALCLGWIDSILHRIDEASYALRFTPRKADSAWSPGNIKRVKELAKRGLMKSSGLRIFNERKQAKSRLYTQATKLRTLKDAYQNRIRANKKAWAFYAAQPKSYQEAANMWIMSAKREETQLKRLTTLIEDSEQKRRLGWFKRYSNPSRSSLTVTPRREPTPRIGQASKRI